MAFISNFQREDYSQAFDIPDGEWDVKISKAAEIKQNKSGKSFISVPLLVNCQTQILPYEIQIWEGKFFNKSMSKFCDAFGLADTDIGNMVKYNGLRGKASFTHKMESFTGADGMPHSVNRCKCNLIVDDQKAAAPLAKSPAPAPAEIPADIWS